MVSNPTDLTTQILNISDQNDGQAPITVIPAQSNMQGDPKVLEVANVLLKASGGNLQAVSIPSK